MAAGTIKMPTYNKNQNTTASEATTQMHFSAQIYGNVVTINGYCKVNIPSGSDTTPLLVATVADGFKPTLAIRGLCGITTNPWEMPETVGYFNVDTNGEIYIKTSVTGLKTVYLSCSYVV